MSRAFAILIVTALSLLGQSEPTLLRIRVVEGDGSSYAIGSRATKGITVLVTDSSGKPVEGASVKFQLPESGPTGSFSLGGRTEFVTTGKDGRAAAWGMQWNRVTGPLSVAVTAAKGSVTAGTACGLSLTDSVAAEKIQGGGHKKLWIVLGVVGGAAAGVAIAARGNSSAQNAAQTPGTPTIGTPTITIGPP